MRAPERSDPRAWNGRPEGAGEAADAASAVPRVSGRAGRCTLTSWRSGRMGWGCREDASGAAISSGAEDGASGAVVGPGDLFRERVWGQAASDSHTATASRNHAWPSHAEPRPLRGPPPLGGAAPFRRSRGCQQFAAAPRFRRLKPLQATEALVESLILAQDQRWRRA